MVANLPPWVSVQKNPVRSTVGLEKLQAGERGAILLAESTNTDVILLDEKSARRVAGDRGLRITGTLGVLGEAAARGLIDLAEAIDRLRRTTFQCSPALLKATLDRFSSR
jgi:predicted nucleic acid-binding protein